MTGIPDNYARVLFDMNLDSGDIETTRKLLTESDELAEALVSPVISRREKRNVIDSLFPDSTKNFVKVMCENGDIGCARSMFESHRELERRRDNAISAVFTYVTKPDDTQVEKLKKKIARDYNKENVELTLVEDPSLIGGFVLTVGDFVLDQSVKTSIQRLKRHIGER